MVENTRVFFSPKREKGEEEKIKWKNTWFLDSVPLGVQFLEEKHSFEGWLLSSEEECEYLAVDRQLRAFLTWPRILLFSLKWTFLWLGTVAVQLSLDFKIRSRSLLLLGIHFSLFPRRHGYPQVLRCWQKRSVFWFFLFFFFSSWVFYFLWRNKR